MTSAVMPGKRPVLQEVPPPRAFRFSDPNPLTSGSYAQSKFRDLPEDVAAVVEDKLRLDAGAWDLFVADGEVYDLVGPSEVFEVWKTASGWGARHFLRPGHEVVQLDDPSGAAWF